MITFIIIIFVIFFILYVIGTFNKNKIQNTKPIKENNIKAKPNSEKNISKEEKLFYKTKEIKSFEIHGINYTKVNDEDFGDFFGHVLCENNSHDKYAVSIHKNTDKLIGYVPKGNQRLNNSISEWHNKKLFAWGNLRFDDYYEKWFGVVYIPVGISDEKIKLIEEFIKLKQLNQKLISKKDFNTIQYFEILENHKHIISCLHKIGEIEEMQYDFPRNIIPSLSKKLETDKEWGKLIELENYSDLIDDLSETYKNSTLNRIEKAKKNCG